MGMKPLIFLHPLSDRLKELKDTVGETAEAENIEIFDVETLDEFNQLCPHLGQYMAMCSNPKLCARLLQFNTRSIKNSESKVILLSAKQYPRKTIDRLNKLGLTDFILDSVPSKTLQYKVKLQMRSIVVKNDTEEDKDSNQFIVRSEDEAEKEEDQKVSGYKDPNDERESSKKISPKDITLVVEETTEAEKPKGRRSKSQTQFFDDNSDVKTYADAKEEIEQKKKNLPWMKAREEERSSGGTEKIDNVWSSVKTKPIVKPETKTPPSEQETLLDQEVPSPELELEIDSKHEPISEQNSTEHDLEEEQETSSSFSRDASPLKNSNMEGDTKTDKIDNTQKGKKSQKEEAIKTHWANTTTYSKQENKKEKEDSSLGLKKGSKGYYEGDILSTDKFDHDFDSTDSNLSEESKNDMEGFSSTENKEDLLEGGSSTDSSKGGLLQADGLESDKLNSPLLQNDSIKTDKINDEFDASLEEDRGIEKNQSMDSDSKINQEPLPEVQSKERTSALLDKIRENREKNAPKKQDGYLRSPTAKNSSSEPLENKSPFQNLNSNQSILDPIEKDKKIGEDYSGSQSSKEELTLKREKNVKNHSEFDDEEKRRKRLEELYALKEQKLKELEEREEKRQRALATEESLYQKKYEDNDNEFVMQEVENEKVISGYDQEVLDSRKRHLSEEIILEETELSDAERELIKDIKDWGEQTIDYSKMKRGEEGFSIERKAQGGEDEFKFIERKSSEEEKVYKGFALEGDIEEDESFEEGDKVIHPDSRGIETIIKVLNLYFTKDIMPSDILSEVTTLLNKERGFGVVSFFYRPHQKEVFNEVHSGHKQLLKESGVEKWEKLKELNFEGWSKAKLPVWSDRTFREDDIQFIYPFYEGIDHLGFAVVTFFNGMKEENAPRIEVALEATRAVYLSLRHKENGEEAIYNELKDPAKEGLLPLPTKVQEDQEPVRKYMESSNNLVMLEIQRAKKEEEEKEKMAREERNTNPVKKLWKRMFG